MANIKLRSPYFVIKTLGGAPSYATMELTLNGASTPQYTVTRNYVASGGSQSSVTFDISELSRDYLNLTYGEDIVSNGDFSDGTTDWTFDGDVTLVGTEAVFTSTDELSRIIQNNVFVVGQFYEITYEVTSYTEGGLRIVNFGLNDPNVDIPSSVGKHTISGIAYQTGLQIKRSGDPTTLKLTNISSNGSYSSDADNPYVDITATVKSYNTSNTLIDTTSYVNDGFDGWSEFSEGANKEMDALSLAQTNTTIYVPENTRGVIPFFGTIDISYGAFSDTATSITVASTDITIKRICEPKFNPIKVTFVNKYGAFQDIWFDKKSIEELSVKRESFKMNLIGITGTYSTTSHSKKVLSVMGNESITMNTGFVDEGMNEVIKELMLSEQVWARIDNIIYPMNVEETSHTYKTSVNDRLVNYTVRFSYAFDLINNIR